MITAFFADGPVRSWVDAKRSDTSKFAVFHRTLLAHGVYWPPSQFEAAFVSLAHDQTALEKTRVALAAAFEAAAG